jgi:aspartokinase-like uncharacterized kinase
MAILAMDQYGFFLSQVIPNNKICRFLKSAKEVSKSGIVPIFLPFNMLSKGNLLEATWDITSDSISAYLAIRLKVSKLILLTDVDGIFTQDPKKVSEARLMSEVSASDLKTRSDRTSVDNRLSYFLLNRRIDAYVVNGKHPYRVEALLADQPTIATRII